MGLMMGAAAAAGALKPTRRLADLRPHLDLEGGIPRQFGGWGSKPARAGDLVNPQSETLIDKLYSQIVERVYFEPATGAQIMLSVAYGADQSEGLQLHVPDYCYPAQGFQVVASSLASIAGRPGGLPVKRLLTQQGARFEAVTYWITVGGFVELSGPARKLAHRLTTRGLAAEIELEISRCRGQIQSQTGHCRCCCCGRRWCWRCSDGGRHGDRADGDGGG